MSGDLWFLFWEVCGDRLCLYVIILYIYILYVGFIEFECVVRFVDCKVYEGIVYLNWILCRCLGFFLFCMEKLNWNWCILKC